jgi:DNA primase
MREDLEQLKQRIPLLEYLQRRRWTGCRVAAREEFVGLCPLHPDTRPSFYVNARKNLFYCHGCHRGGDLIRFVELSENLSFRESLSCLKQDIALAEESELFTRATAFFHAQLHRYSEAVGYLQNRGLRDPDLASAQASAPCSPTCGWLNRSMQSSLLPARTLAAVNGRLDRR